eukprot:TRINITY_DN21657_c0_g1_i1.p1 TRINITY_DN21657_c0_g1~~TRINITY_DN21657_c0_g1_i1.p1  ORF type:complete len:258 (+),score=37.76 TRINITY_DN21657_c0_g1_i1:111-884(+)
MSVAEIKLPYSGLHCLQSQCRSQLLGGDAGAYGACLGGAAGCATREGPWFDRRRDVEKDGATKTPTKLHSMMGGLPSEPLRTWLAAPQQAHSTAFAQLWRPVLAGILAVECGLCILRPVVLRDCVGAFFMFLAILLGLYAWLEDMNITFIKYWGVMSCINGMLDAVVLADAVAHMPVPLFSRHLPWAYNMTSVLRIAGPLSQLLGVPLAWFLNKDHEETKQASELDEKWAGTVRMDALVLGAFSGQGQRLGSAWDRT